jgi:hypothetical protein
MLSAYHVHPEFGYFCPTPYRRRELLVAVVSILFGAMIGGRPTIPIPMAPRRRRASISRILRECRWPPWKPRLWRRPTPTRRSRQKSLSSPFRFGAYACVQPCLTHSARQWTPQPPHRPE